MLATGPNGSTDRWYPTVTRLPDTRLLITGGYEDVAPTPAPIPAVETLDPDHRRPHGLLRPHDHAVGHHQPRLHPRVRAAHHDQRQRPPDDRRAERGGRGQHHHAGPLRHDDRPTGLHGGGRAQLGHVVADAPDPHDRQPVGLPQRFGPDRQRQHGVDLPAPGRHLRSDHGRLEDLDRSAGQPPPPELGQPARRAGAAGQRARHGRRSAGQAGRVHRSGPELQGVARHRRTRASSGATTRSRCSCPTVGCWSAAVATRAPTRRSRSRRSSSTCRTTSPSPGR